MQPKKRTPAPAPSPLARARADFARGMREARLNAGLSQRELAERLAVRGLAIDPSAVTRIEKNARPVKLEEAVLIAAVLDTRVSELLGEPELNPVDHLRDLREDADDSMHRIVHGAAAWLSQLDMIQQHLQEHPGLLPILGQTRRPGHKAVDPPGSPEDYLDWVAKRVSKLDSVPVFVTNVDNQERMRGLVHVALGLLLFVNDEEYSFYLPALKTNELAREESDG